MGIWAGFNAVVPRAVLAGVFALVLAVHGFRKKKLSVSGAVAGFFVGFFMCFCGLRFGVTLIVFYLLGSRMTRFKHEYKRKLEADFDASSRRTAVQVFANAGVGLCVVVFLRLLRIADGGDVADMFADNAVADFARNPVATRLLVAFVASIACSTGDTFASELGILSRTPPRLITTWRVVPAGTNGGVTWLGVVVSIAGGLIIGAAFAAASWMMGLTGGGESPLQSQFVWVGALGGFLGSFIDSLLGATVQYSGRRSRSSAVVVSAPARGSLHIAGRDLLDNHQVNFAASLLTAAALAAALPPLLFYS